MRRFGAGRRGEPEEPRWPDWFDPQRVAEAMTSAVVMDAMVTCTSAALDAREDAVVHAMSSVAELTRSELASLVMAFSASLSASICSIAQATGEDPFEVMSRFAAGFASSGLRDEGLRDEGE